MESFKKMSIPLFHGRLKLDNFKGNPSFISIAENAEILEVWLFGDWYAWVIAQFSGPDDRYPIDVRIFERSEGKWLNAGNDRYPSLDEAKQKFDRITTRLQENKVANTSEDRTKSEQKQRLKLAEEAAVIRKRGDIVISSIQRSATEYAPLLDKLEQVKKPDEVGALLSLLLAADDPKVLDKLSQLSENKMKLSDEERQRIVNSSPEWKKMLRETFIMETYTKGDSCMVVGRLGSGAKNPYNAFWLKYDKEKQRWFNCGNDRFDSTNEAIIAFSVR